MSNQPNRNAAGQPADAFAVRVSRRTAASRVCGALEELLSEGRDLGGGAVLDYVLDAGLRKAVNDLRATYPPPNPHLPAGGQRLWRRVEAMVDPELHRGGPPAGWSEFVEAVDTFMAWLLHHYGLRAPDGTDPGEWERRIQCDEPTRTIVLDGYVFELPKRTHVRLIRELVDAARRGIPSVTQRELAEAVYNAGSSAKSIERLIDELPPLFREMVECSPGRGTWIRLPRLA
ncbi:MAG: hypothetical protein C0501_23820 [Isosphaera sp.]|nr:hypothetical protein [Isosphaera sp.]